MQITGAHQAEGRKSAHFARACFCSSFSSFSFTPLYSRRIARLRCASAPLGRRGNTLAPAEANSIRAKSEREEETNRAYRATRWPIDFLPLLLLGAQSVRPSVCRPAESDRLIGKEREEEEEEKERKKEEKERKGEF